MEAINTFCSWSGQKLNAAKSSMFFDQNIPPPQRLTLLASSGFTEGHFLTTYLGAPLFPGRVKIEYFAALEEKVRQRISGWLCKFISMGGRITIIEAILNSILVHTLAVLPTPKAVIDRISSLLTSFLWNQNDKRRRHLIGWNNVCCPKVAGGLGITPLDKIQLALHHKLAWRSISFFSIWGKFVRSRHHLN
ncbi:hypothetical protein QQ045_013117 [Rhodiola kirilowii]